MPTARIGLQALASLCRRVATALSAGINLRTAWASEVQRFWGTRRKGFQTVNTAIQSGQSLSDALVPTGNLFPRLFREMVGVGEQTGHLAEVFDQLAAHYELQLKLRRAFFAIITWPLVQLAMAIVIVGVGIWVMGLIEQMSGMRLDFFGFGLVGTQGLLIYVGVLLLVGGTIAGAIVGVRRGVASLWWLQQLVDRLPVLGPALHTLALSRFAWSLHLAMNAGMEVRRAMKLSLRNAQGVRLTAGTPAIDEALAAGESVHTALARSAAFPTEFLDALQVGEQSGFLVESLERLSRQCRDQAQSALTTLTTAVAYAVWAAIAAMIIVIIFRVFGFYMNLINSAGNL